LDDHASDLTWPAARPGVDWESLWAPHDESTYAAALAFIRPDDTVLDIGAGDLRFARRAAGRARSVIAVERRADIWASAAADGGWPANLIVIHGDARTVPYPARLTVAVLLMRHCRHFAEYVQRLRAAGCARLITNARWGMDVECMTLAGQVPFASAMAGWYACACGAIGLKAASPDNLTPEALARTTEVSLCPACVP